MEEYAVSEEIRSEEGWYVFIGMLMVFLVFSSIGVALQAGSVNGAMMWGRGIALQTQLFTVTPSRHGKSVTIGRLLL